jgi:hypothetical protein
LNAAIVEVGPGGTVEIVGEYQRNAPLFITSGGTPGQVVTVRGGVFRSNRTAPWTPGAVDGSAFFALGVGASYLHFEDMTFENVGNGCFQLGAPLSELSFENVTADNVQRFLENRIVAGQIDATITGLTVTGCVVSGFSKGAIRLQYGTNDVHVEQTVGVSGVDGDNFAIGVHMGGTVHDCMFVEVSMDDCVQTRTAELYWNGDGFASEQDTHDLIFIDCSASGCTDGGWDLKADRVLMVRCEASDNKRNFRLWGIDVELIDCVGIDPHIRGGTGTQTQVHAADVARVEIMGGTFTDCDPATIVFDSDGSAEITVLSAAVTRHTDSDLFTHETNAAVTLGAVTDSFCS